MGRGEQVEVEVEEVEREAEIYFPTIFIFGYDL